MLFVCRANQTRSVAAELLTRSLAQHQGVSIDVRSAGLRPVAGAPIDPKMQRLLARRGVDTDCTASTPVDAETLEWADVVLCAESQQVLDILDRFGSEESVVEEDGSGLRTRSPLALRSSTMIGFSHRANGVGFGDLDDPTGGTRREYRRCVDLLAEVAASVVDWARPAALEQSASRS